MMEYKGYTARVEYDAQAEIFHGQVLHLRDVITFQGRSVEELKEALADSVEDYLEFCAERGESPERPYSGKFLIRTNPNDHRLIALAASLAGESINTWASRILASAAVHQLPAPRHAVAATRSPLLLKSRMYRSPTRYANLLAYRGEPMQALSHPWVKHLRTSHRAPDHLAPLMKTQKMGMANVS